jgi:hypothetical protein
LRYYDLKIIDANGLVLQPPTARGGFTRATGGSTFTSWVKGPLGMRTDPGALNIEFDLPITPQHTPQGQHYIRIWGVGLPMLSQASNLNGMSFVLSAGMKPGLPLATAAAPQAGILVEGEIYQSFGNWQGVNQTLDLIVQGSSFVPEHGIAFNWPANTPLAPALSATLYQGFPAYKQNINISAPLLQNAPEWGAYPSLSTFSQYLQVRTQAMGAKSTGNANYPGVQILAVNASKTIYVFDNSYKTVQVAFQDLIGQPTWMGPGTVSFKTVMRSDIAIYNQIQFPPGVMAPFVLTSTNASGIGAQSSSKTAFQGLFSVNEVHHYGNFRQPDGESWNTTFSVASLALPS